MTAAVGPYRARCVVAEAEGHRAERMPSTLELFGFGCEDEPPSPS
ncbi:hypothetical protein AB0L82_31365 [Nocardia sp. NPDC052001]